MKNSNEPQDHSRRNFIKRVSGAYVTAYISSSGLKIDAEPIKKELEESFEAKEISFG